MGFLGETIDSVVMTRLLFKKHAYCQKIKDINSKILLKSPDQETGVSTIAVSDLNLIKEIISTHDKRNWKPLMQNLLESLDLAGTSPKKTQSYFG